MTGKKSRPYERACSRICFLAASNSSGKGARVCEAMRLHYSFLVWDEQVVKHRKVLLVQRDKSSSFNERGRGDHRIGKSDAMGLHVLTKEQAPCFCYPRIHGDD